MRRKFSVVLFLAARTIWACPQQGGPASAAPIALPTQGPTMEETIAFINDAYASVGMRTSGGEYLHGKVRQSGPLSLQLVKTCSVVLQDVARVEPRIGDGFAEFNGLGFSRMLLDLSKTDPLSVSVEESTTTPTRFQVVASNAYFATELAPEVPAGTAPTPAPPAPIPFKIWNSWVQATSGTSIVVVTGFGKLTSLPLDSDIKIDKMVDGHFYPGSIADIKPGAWIDTERKVTTDKKGKAVGTHEEMTNINDVSAPQSKKEAHLGSFDDKDQAERGAKAYIHAIVICYKSPAPSLF